MDAIILAAGRETGMRPSSDTRPKPMLPLAGQPVAAHVADAAVAAGAETLVFTVDDQSDAVREYFGATHRDASVEYAVQETGSGTADAVAAAIDHIDGRFAVLNGDNVYRPSDVSELFERAPAVGFTRVDPPEEHGGLSTDNGVVTDVEEQPTNPTTSTANTGAYAFPAAARELLDVPTSERGGRELTDVLSRLLRCHRVAAVEFVGWADMGYP